MEYNATGCEDCPLCNFSQGFIYSCNHPKFFEKVLFIEIDEEGTPITPKECPLLENPILIKRRPWQRFEMFWNKSN